METWMRIATKVIQCEGWESPEAQVELAGKKLGKVMEIGHWRFEKGEI
jgi:predicted nucleic-acid-binding Zn-ribbon protein